GASRGQIGEGAGGFNLRNARAAFRGYFGEPRDLFEYGRRAGSWSTIEFQTAEIGAIGIAGMRANRQVSSKRLLNRGSHRELIAGVASAGNVHGSQKGHERLLSAVGDGLRYFAHIAIQVDGVHS